MGNSPSKNDSSPTSSSSNSSTLTSSSGAELEPDESDLSHRSNQPRSLRSSSKKIFNVDNSVNNKYKTTSNLRKKSISNSPYKKNIILNSSSSDEDIPKYGQTNAIDLGIKNPIPRSSKNSFKKDDSDDISSSLESDKSFMSSSSLSSVTSTTPPKASSKSALNQSLDPILERSVETTPEPNRSSTKEKSKPSNTRKNSARKLSNLTSYQSNSSTTSTVSTSSSNGETDIDNIISTLIEIGSTRTYHHNLPISTNDIKYILSKSRSIFMSQPTLLKLAPPVKVVGDIHGQFNDLIRIFENCGYPPSSNYLFLGDYVDRGKQSIETILLMLCFKIKYPENFFMLRGNHESANITKIYGFYDECKRRLSSKIWKGFVDVFNTLPLAATINDKIFAIHGGLSPDLSDLKQISKISRPTDIPETGLLADLLWSDPDARTKTWSDNDRGVSYCFGKRQVDQFCEHFNFDLIVRGHMVVEDGYEFFNKRKLVTVFSAPNYCGEFNNYGAIMCVDKHLVCSFELIKPELKKK